MASPMLRASAANNPKQPAISPEQTKLLTDKRLVAAVALIGSTQTTLRPSLIKMGAAFDQIHRVAGDLWSWWLKNKCQQQTGVSPGCAQSYEDLFQRSRLQVEDNPVAKAVFEQADVSRPRNIEKLNRTLGSKSVRTQIAAAGTDTAEVEKVAASIIAKANPKPVSTKPTEVEQFDSAFKRLARLFSKIATPKNATKAPSRSRRSPAASEKPYCMVKYFRC